MDDRESSTDIDTDPDALLTNVAHHRELLAYDAVEQSAATDVSLARAE
ncbi:MAG: hypothetical protein ACREPT_01645 [Rudaea sp.]